MKKKSSVASPSSTKKPNLRSSTGPGSIHFSAKTPEKPPQRTRNRGVALSVSEIKRVGKELQDRKQQCSETTSSQTKSSVRRQISLWPSSSSEPKVTGDEPKLPQKYEILGEFFHHLDSLILIFRLKRWTPSFKKISSRIESLADRRFTMGHLAQLKFVLPEAIILKKILVHDERTSCMEADINISIDPKAVGSDERVPLRKLFWTRLRDFWESHPEGDEIPEEALPEPFNRPKEDSLLDKLKTSLPTKMSSCMPYNVIVNKAESADNDDNVSVPVETSVETSPAKLPSEAASTESCPTICASQESSGVSSATPSKDKSLKSIDVLGTPVKLVSTPIRLMSATPALRPSKRPYMSPDDNTTSSLNKLARRPPSSRSLKFNTPVKHKEVVSEHNAGDLPFDDDVFDILPENLIQSIREKERMTMEERDPAISQARRRAKNITRLPNLFDMIRILLRERSCITKSELVSKIISGDCDITDRSEVEEQLSLLLELAPEWISEKLASSGDLLVMINKIASPKTIRASLEAANCSQVSHDFNSNSNLKRAFLVDTLALVRGLEAKGVPSKQAEVITAVITQVLNDSLQNVAHSFVTKSEMQKSELLQESNLSKFKTEVQSSQEHNFSLLQRENEMLRGDIEKMRSELRYEIDKVTAGQRLDLNLERGRIRDELANQNAVTSNLTNKLDREIHELRAQLEAAKYDVIKYCIGTLVSISTVGLAVIRIIL